MKALLTAVSTLVVLMSFGCASSQQNEDTEELYQNRVTVNPPDGESNQESSQVYIDSLKIITTEDRRAMVIYGSFPDGCTHLESAEHSLLNDTLDVTLSAWRNPELMCSQVLTQFTFIYDKFDNHAFDEATTVIVNGTTYNN